MRPAHAGPRAPARASGEFPRRSALAVYCADAAVMARLPAALPMSMDVLRFSDWPGFERAATSAICSVVVLPWLAESGVLPEFRGLKLRLPLHPTVLVTEKDADNLRLLKDVSVEELVWLHDVDRELWAAVSRARAASLLRQMASTFEEAEWLPPKLRTAIAHAFRSEVPITSVRDLAAEIGCDRRTLWRHWRKGFGNPPPLQPADFVDWLVLLRAAGLKVPGRKWTVVATELGVHEHTIARGAKRLAGLTLRDVAGGGQPFVARLFAHQVLRPLLSPAPPERLRAVR